MISRIIIPPTLLNQFRKLAKKTYPLEALMTVWGRIEGSTVTVLSLRIPSQKATESQVDSSMGERVGEKGEGIYLGTIHSHPDSLDASPSEADWEDAFNTGELCFGVMRIGKKPNGKFETSTRFWPVMAPVALIHPRIRKPRPLPHPEKGTTHEPGCGVVLSTLEPS